MRVDTGPTRRHILITGVPGIGKTTLVTSLIKRLPGSKAGFFTREVREGGVRKGFLIVTLDGVTAPLAEIARGGDPRVGKYRVLRESIDEVAVPSIETQADFVFIDEIGKMETVSERFMRAVDQAFSGRSTVIAAIAGKGNSYIEGIKRRSDVLLFEVTRQNRDSLAEEISKKALPLRAGENG